MSKPYINKSMKAYMNFYSLMPPHEVICSQCKEITDGRECYIAAGDGFTFTWWPRREQFRELGFDVRPYCKPCAKEISSKITPVNGIKFESKLKFPWGNS